MHKRAAQESTAEQSLPARTTATQRGRARPARWIATLAAAGATAICCATAARAAVPEQVPTDVSSTTCNSLSADFSATLLQAAKHLLATPPDMPRATDQVGQANKLDDAMKSLACGNNGSPGAPAASSAPTQTSTATDSASPTSIDSSTDSSTAPASSAASSPIPTQPDSPGGQSPLSIYFGAPLLQGPPTGTDTTDPLAPLSASEL